MGLPGLSLGSTATSNANNSGGNQSVTINGASQKLPASFWGSPRSIGGTSQIAGGGQSLSVGTLLIIVGVGLALWHMSGKSL